MQRQGLTLMPGKTAQQMYTAEHGHRDSRNILYCKRLFISLPAQVLQSIKHPTFTSVERGKRTKDT
ncbi:unnamed protein product [Chrysodeixis includens]|uniref:Uncharacterized protein n=1 Tax=Chrysodeixis includens TaxID=689277 RepID=A0A9P0BMK5_CHRIL|nr:unnamed protein product [Chrysodeixis includens]